MKMKYTRDDYNLTLPVFDKIVEDLKVPDLWVRDALATDVLGYPVASNNSEAVHWCLLGLIEKHTYENGVKYQIAKDEIEKEISSRTHVKNAGIIYYNDKYARHVSDVLSVVCEAKQAVHQKTLPWWNWRHWIPRSILPLTS